MTQIRLLHLMKSFDIGGVERSTINYSNKISPFTDYIGIFARQGKFSHDNIIAKEVKVFFSFGKISNFFMFLPNLIKMMSIIKLNKINIVHYHQRIFIPFIYSIKLFSNTKIIYTHHTVFNDFLNNLLVANKYIAVSHSTELDLIQFGKKCTLIKHGIEIEQTKDFFKNKDVTKIGYVGRFDVHKGIPTLLEAFKILLNQKNKVELMFIGDGKLKKYIENYTAVNKLQNYITVFPPEVNLSNIYSKIDLLVFPSEKLEGFGLVAIEAMSFGIPVIVSDLDSFNEYVKSNENALIFRRKDIINLTETLLKLINDYSIRNKVIKNAYYMVETNFSTEITIKRYFDLYTNCI